jgi:hypothetical protein
MMKTRQLSALIVGLSLCFGMTALGSILGYSAIKHKEFERTVTVKGLSEREYPADIVIWTVDLTLANNSLPALHAAMENSVAALRSYLINQSVAAEEITFGAAVINDSYTNQYRNIDNNSLRYTASRSVTVYSENVAAVRNVISSFASSSEALQFEGSWWSHAQYVFDSLNEVKPDMIEEATRNAREVASKFAEDSDSRLGRIKQASQGQFSISDRDSSNPHIKSVRVVSTIEYYLAD